MSFQFFCLNLPLKTMYIFPNRERIVYPLSLILWQDRTSDITLRIWPLPSYLLLTIFYSVVDSSTFCASSNCRSNSTVCPWLLGRKNVAVCAFEMSSLAHISRSTFFQLHKFGMLTLSHSANCRVTQPNNTIPCQKWCSVRYTFVNNQFSMFF